MVAIWLWRLYVSLTLWMSDEGHLTEIVQGTETAKQGQFSGAA